MENSLIFMDTAQEMGALLAEKDAGYGEIMDSTATFLKILYPNGIPAEMQERLGLQVRIFDKLRRSARGGHDVAEDWRDICGYGMQGLVHCRKRKAAGEDTTEEERDLSLIAEGMQNHFCKDYPYCDSCPLKAFKNSHNLDCVDACREYPLEAIEIMNKMKVVKG